MENTVKTCVSDDLSGDMLALSWPNLVIVSHEKCLYLPY